MGNKNDDRETYQLSPDTSHVRICWNKKRLVDNVVDLKIGFIN